MGWAYCEKHKRAGHVLTSPKLVAAAKNNEPVDGADIRYIQFNSTDGSYQNPVDLDFFEKLGFPADQSIVELNDRDKSSNQLNDRIVIVKITKEMRGVCPDCLEAVLPATALATRDIS